MKADFFINTEDNETTLEFLQKSYVEKKEYYIIVKKNDIPLCKSITFTEREHTGVFCSEKATYYGYLTKFITPRLYYKIQCEISDAYSLLEHNAIYNRYSSFFSYRKVFFYKPNSMLTYCKEIAEQLAIVKSESYLKDNLGKLTFISPESVLHSYLSSHIVEQRIPETLFTIFPFQFNLSQKKALENALTHSISVIQGPPGTGKTQTILNLLANLITLQNKSVAVVSNNNPAVKNVIEKLNKYGYGFLTALLGNDENRNEFFSNMPLPSVDGWNCEEDYNDLLLQIYQLDEKVNELMKKEQRKVMLQQELRNWKLEQEHFHAYYSNQKLDELTKLPSFSKFSDKILSFLADTSVAKEYQQDRRILYKLKLMFKYHIFNFKRLNQEETALLLSLQKKYYEIQVKDLEKQLSELDVQLANASFQTLLKKIQSLSEKYFRKHIYDSHHDMAKPRFSKDTYKKNFKTFAEEFPVILTTTSTLHNSIPKNTILDYVIIDEASQVDLITAILTLSCCRNVVIIGDTKQLPMIVNHNIQNMIKTVPPQEGYNYFEHNIISSILRIYGDKVPCITLKEHYRCHPDIIEFCNQKYYSGELIAYTDSSICNNPLAVCRTAQGNHAREFTFESGIYNQRELDVIKEGIKHYSYTLENESIGFLTPFRKQANKAHELLGDDTESDTIHKFQGREADLIFMSTVLDLPHITKQRLDFINNPNLINVAVSRAIKRFILVTDHDLFFEREGDIPDLIRYIRYRSLDKAVFESQVVSIFDLLYRQFSPKLLELKKKMNPDARWQSEEAVKVLLDKILCQKSYELYTYTQQILIRNLLMDFSLMTDDEAKYVNNRASLDFLIFRKLDKACIFAIEVNGFNFHENNPKQIPKDAMKQSILEKYNIPLLVLKTNGSGEEQKIIEYINKYGNRNTIDIVSSVK